MADLVMNFLEKALPTIGMVAGGALAAPLDPFTGGAASVVAGGLGSALGKFGENELTGQKATSGVMGSLAGGLAGNFFGGLAGDVLEGAAPEIANATGVFGKAMSGAIKGSVTGAVGSTAGGIAQGQPITGKNLSMDFLQGAGIGGITGGLFGGATAAVGNQVKPAYALDDETAVAAAKEQDPDKVEKILEPKTGPVVAKDVAPAVAKTSQGDPAIVKNIVQDDLNNKLSTSQQATTPVSPDTTTQSPAPAQMPPTTSVSDINTPQQVAQQGGEATQAFMNAPGETNGVTKIMEESNPLTKNRGFLQTLQKSTNTTPELKQAISEIEPQTYTQKPNDPMVARAKALIDTNYDTAVQRITGSNHLSDEDITIGHQLLSKAQAEGRSDDAVDLATRLDNSLRDSGREVQAASIWGRMTPEGMLRHAANVVNQAKEAGKKAELTPEVTKKINDNMEVLRSLPGGTVGDTAKNIREAVNQSQTTPTIDHARGAVQDSISNLQQALPLEGVETRSGAVENTGTKVAKNVEQAAAPPKIKPKVDQLVNEITKKVKQEMLEPKPNAPRISAIDTLREVFGRNQEAQESLPICSTNPSG